jgi:ABC-type microcin C transport system permease subunit YejB
MRDLMADYKKAMGGGGSSSTLMQMMMQQTTTTPKNGKGAKKDAKENQIDTSSQPKKQKEEKVDDKTAQEYYQAFNFEQSVRTFTDFLQAKMQPQNQLILPNSTVINEGSYQFYL